jgi:Zn-dependent alcohol dehydrogenase
MKTRAAVLHAPGKPFEVAEIDLDEPLPDEVGARAS